MSGPFVQETGYPWDSLHTMNFCVTEGTQAPSLDGSRLLRDWMTTRSFNLTYKEVNADHGGMVPLVLPDVFNFFDKCREKTGIAIPASSTTKYVSAKTTVQSSVGSSGFVLTKNTIIQKRSVIEKFVLSGRQF
jgi:hypothetical protein